MLQHVACAGQTIGQLAERYGCPREELAELNGFVGDAPLASGVVIWIPAAQPGEMHPEMSLPVLRLPGTILAALRQHAQRNGGERLLLQLRPAGEGDATHLHFPGK
jgi:hypothetical protein